MRLRRATDQDSLEVHAMQATCLPGDQPIPMSGYWWVIPGVAFCAVKSCSYPGEWYLSRSGVLPAHRGQGLQARMVRVRERFARSQGGRWIMSDTHRDNMASSNTLIRCGYRLFSPREPWALPDSLYWRKRL